MNRINNKCKFNNKGFTLIEILAVIVLIAMLGMITVPSVLSIINSSNNTTYDILVKDITIAGSQLYEEIDYMNNTLYHYNMEGDTNSKVIIGEDLEGNEIGSNRIEVNLQTLVSNGLLKSNNSSNKSSNNNEMVIINPNTKDDIGECKILIIKVIDEKFNTSYQIKNNSVGNSNCPLDSEYEKVNK